MSAPGPSHSDVSASSPALLLRLVLLFIWVVTLTLLSLLPADDVAGAGLGWDKLNHAAAYAVLALLLIRVLRIRHALTVRLLGLAWAVAFGYGLLLEGLQRALGNGRYWETGDLLANGLGALAACVVFRRFTGRWLRHDDAL